MTNEDYRTMLSNMYRQNPDDALIRAQYEDEFGPTPRSRPELCKWCGKEKDEHRSPLMECWNLGTFKRHFETEEGATPSPSPKCEHCLGKGFVHNWGTDFPCEKCGVRLAASPDRLEAPIQAEMCQFLREDGWEILITNPVSDKSKGRGFGTPGMADFLAMRPMKCLRLGSGDSIEVSRAVCEVLWVEAKSGNNRAKKHQAEWHRNQRAIGFLTWIANEDFPATVEGFKAHYRASGLARRRDL